MVLLCLSSPDGFEDDAELNSKGLRPSFARNLLVCSIDRQSPAPFSGIGDGERVGCEILGAGGAIGTSTTSEPLNRN